MPTAMSTSGGPIINVDDLGIHPRVNVGIMEAFERSIPISTAWGAPVPKTPPPPSIHPCLQSIDRPGIRSLLAARGLRLMSFGDRA